MISAHYAYRPKKLKSGAQNYRRPFDIDVIQYPPSINQKYFIAHKNKTEINKREQRYYSGSLPPCVLQPDLVSLMGEGRLRSSLSVLNASAGSAVDDRALFRLSAVVVHVGGPRSGHFATYRRGNGFESKRWWYTSDTLVHEVSLQEVLRCAAYMLFYERLVEPPPPTTTHF
ncbi:jg22625 [Pararge aegeria aegeria]|uniref:ubiquitinyl hydrolase 1 n=1 Tax=Pararge aegeria aegeria TaxID=348720 RepID=A0A8S4R2D3_9NEOP|nr:jg22625 [Pararge aegeria aegeria]